MIAVILLLLAGSPAPTGEVPVRLAQLSIEQRIIIRVPLSRTPARRSLPVTEMRERKGPRCVEMKDIRSAALLSADSLMLVTDEGDRYRARMERGCRAGNFYTGFYMEPGEDGELCARRDSIRARSGMECVVESFSRIVAKK